VARGLLILDANVLIDFCTTDPTLLALVEQHVGRVHIASPVLAKVEQMDADLVERLGLTVEDPPLVLAVEAATRARGSPLAFDDWGCLLMAQANGWTCVTNDKRLRKECGTRGLAVDTTQGAAAIHTPFTRPPSRGVAPGRVPSRASSPPEPPRGCPKHAIRLGFLPDPAGFG
jgi:predicted nucleic acid-binding protein